MGKFVKYTIYAASFIIKYYTNNRRKKSFGCYRVLNISRECLYRRKMSPGLYAILLTVFLPRIAAHGRLIDPPSRASAWRYGFDTPHNYNDHELYCGGFTRQWVKNEGKCGVCGDAWDTK
jgi:hypothetical protein